MEFVFTWQYGARYSNAVMPSLNFFFFLVNLPKHVPTLMSKSLSKEAARFIKSSDM
jgi:hypothetical protein